MVEAPQTMLGLPAPSLPKLGRRLPSITRRLTAMALLLLLPMIALSALILVQYTARERGVLTAQMRVSARSIALAIDADLGANQAVLTTLASDAAADINDFAKFRARALTALGDDRNRWIVLYRPSGEMVVNTRVPPGSPLPKSGNLETVLRVAESGQPSISDLVYAGVDQSMIAVITIPVFDENKLVYVMGMAFPLTRLQNLIEQQHLEEGWFSVVIDRKGTVLARTLNADETRGKAAVAEFTAAARAASEGVVDTARLEGDPIHLVFARAERSGWTAALWIDRRVLDSNLWQSTWQLGGGFALFAAGTLALALFYGRRIARPITDLAGMASWLGRGEVPPRLYLDLKEAQETADQLHLAGETLTKDTAERNALLATLEDRVAARTRQLADSEARSRASSLYSRSLLEASLDPLLTFDADGRITDVNEAAVLATGLPRTALIGSAFANCFTEPDQARAINREVFAQGATKDRLLGLRRADGNVTDVLCNAAVYRDAGGAIAGVFAAARDVTALRRAQEAQLRANRALRMVHVCNDVINHAEDETTMLSALCQDMIDTGGYRLVWIGSVEDDAKKSIRPVAWAGFDEDYVRSIHASWADNERGRGPTGTAVRTGKPVTARDMVTDQNFAPWRQKALEKGYRSSITVPLLTGERVYGAFTIYATQPDAFSAEEIALLEELAGDIAFGTMALRDKDARQSAEAHLRVSEERYRMLVRATAQMVWMTDPAGNVIDFPEWRAFTGQTPEEVAGSGWANALHPDDRARSLATWLKAIEAKAPCFIEYRLRHRDGEYHDIESRGVPLLMQDGSIREWVGTCTDITERKRAEEEVRRLNAELEQRVAERTAQLEGANKELESFSYSVSHDLRTPLRAIDGFSRILLEDYNDKLDTEGKRVLGVVRQGAEKMARLIDDILAFSRAGRLELTPTEIDTNALVADVLQELEPAKAGREIAFAIGALPPIVGDQAMIRRVWTNFLDNAIKFTRPKADARIEIGAMPGDNETIYFIKDNGVGFDMQYAPKLFGVFQRLHGVDEFPGTGIGLAIVKRIVERHGGRVWAESKINEGATFYFALPRKEVAESAAGAPGGDHAG